MALTNVEKQRRWRDKRNKAVDTAFNQAIELKQLKEELAKSKAILKKIERHLGEDWYQLMDEIKN